MRSLQNHCAFSGSIWANPGRDSAHFKSRPRTAHIKKYEPACSPLTILSIRGCSFRRMCMLSCACISNAGSLRISYAYTKHSHNPVRRLFQSVQLISSLLMHAVSFELTLCKTWCLYHSRYPIPAPNTTARPTTVVKAA